MRSALRAAAAIALLALILPLSGCYLFPTTRKLPVPKGPSVVQTVIPDDLVAQLNQRWAALNSLNATVEMQASVLKTKEGVAKDYTTIRGLILMRKPEMLRVYGRVPVIGTRAFDMVSDGHNFTLWIPSRNVAFKGTNSMKKRSVNQFENLRPGFFLDALVVRGLEPDDEYMVTAETDTIEDTARKHLYSVPEYQLSVMRRKPGSPQKTPVRVVTFHRDDLLPYEQDIYDSEGNLETQVRYSAYQEFGSSRYPGVVTIRRPIEEIQIVLTVEKVVENQPLTDDQFVLNPTDGTKIQNLE